MRKSYRSYDKPRGVRNSYIPYTRQSCGHDHVFGRVRNQRSISFPGTRKNLIHHLLEWSCGVDDDAVLRNVFFRLMQAYSEFPFLWFSAEVSWVQCHSLINPPVHGVQVNIEDKHAVK